jgi:REP element-mobilizing transposase RayT
MMKECDENEIYHEMYLHLLWSTLKQQSLILPSVGRYLYAYMCDLALTHECTIIDGQVCEDHIQLILKISHHSQLDDLIITLKVASSLWMRTNFPTMRDFE